MKARSAGELFTRHAKRLVKYVSERFQSGWAVLACLATRRKRFCGETTPTERRRSGWRKRASQFPTRFASDQLGPQAISAIYSTLVSIAEFSVNSPSSMMVLVKSMELLSSSCMVHFIDVTKLSCSA